MPKPYDLAELGLDGASEVAQLLARHPGIEPWSYGDGEFLIRQDEASQAIFILLKGGLVVEQAPASAGTAPVVLACLTAEPDQPAIVGEMAYLGAQPRAASVRSSGRSHALCLNPGHIDAIIEGFPQLTRVICQQFSRRLQDTDAALRRLQDRFALDPQRRMAGAGEVLFSAGEPATTLVQLVAGAVRLEDGQGVRTVTAETLPQGFLDPGPFFRGGAWTCTATVADPAFLVTIQAGRREAAVACFPELVLELLGQS